MMKRAYKQLESETRELKDKATAWQKQNEDLTVRTLTNVMEFQCS
jgi:hypothetical protein